MPVLVLTATMLLLKLPAVLFVLVCIGWRVRRRRRAERDARLGEVCAHYLEEVLL